MASYLEGSVQFLLDNKPVQLTRLERHILYCLDEQRDVSDRYSGDDVRNADQGLIAGGFMWESDEGYKLTDYGQRAVAACRERHDAKQS